MNDDTQQQQTIQPPQRKPLDDAQGKENTIVQFPKTHGDSQQQAQLQSNHQNQQQSWQPSGAGMHKELEPMPSLHTNTEWMKPVEQPVELEPDVEETGVEAIPAMPQIYDDHKAAGIQLAKEAQPMDIEKEPDVQIKSPLTKAQAQQMTKGTVLTKDTSNPMLWLALLVLRQFQILEKQKNHT